MGRLGLLIHSTAGYVDPGWKGNLTLELSNVANLPIALYFGMRIGQISYFEMSSPVVARIALQHIRTSRTAKGIVTGLARQYIGNTITGKIIIPDRTHHIFNVGERVVTATGDSGRG